MARPRRKIEDRRAALIAAATQVFTDKGFRQTQMSDIAQEMGVSVGSLYNWVDSKDTLFAWTLADAFEMEVPWEEPVEPVSFIRARQSYFDSGNLTPLLDEALGNPPGDDFDAELTDVIGELYDFNLRFGSGIRLIESSTVDFPELNALYYDHLRRNFLSKLERYLEDRQDHGLLAETNDLAVTGRSLIELIAWWTIHRMNDPSRAEYESAHLRDEVVRFAVRALTGKG